MAGISQLNHYLKASQCLPAILKAPLTATSKTTSNLSSAAPTSLTATSPKRDQTTDNTANIATTTTTTTVDDFPRPSADIEKLWRKTASRAARKGYQIDWVKTGKTLEA